MMHMTRQGNAKSDMVLMTLADGALGNAQWDSVDLLHQEFSKDGALAGAETSKVSAAGQSVNGALSAPLELAAGETKSVTFVLTWHFKEGQHGSNGKAKIVLEWPNAMGVAAYMQENLADLTQRTRLFHDTLYASNLPVWLLDRMSSQLAVLRSLAIALMCGTTPKGTRDCFLNSDARCARKIFPRCWATDYCLTDTPINLPRQTGTLARFSTPTASTCARWITSGSSRNGSRSRKRSTGGSTTGIQSVTVFCKSTNTTRLMVA